MSTYINNNNRTQQPHISIEQLQPNQALPCYCTAIAIADCQLLAAAAGGWWMALESKSTSTQNPIFRYIYECT